MPGMKSEHPNPAGREGRPISLYPLKPNDAIKGLMMVTPEPKAERGKTRPKVSKRTAKKR